MCWVFDVSMALWFLSEGTSGFYWARKIFQSLFYAVHTFSHLILSALQDRRYCYPHCTNAERQANLPESHIAGEYWGKYLYWGRLVLQGTIYHHVLPPWDAPKLSQKEKGPVHWLPSLTGVSAGIVFLLLPPSLLLFSSISEGGVQGESPLPPEPGCYLSSLLWDFDSYKPSLLCLQIHSLPWFKS